MGFMVRGHTFSCVSLFASSHKRSGEILRSCSRLTTLVSAGEAWLDSGRGESTIISLSFSTDGLTSSTYGPGTADARSRYREGLNLLGEDLTRLGLGFNREGDYEMQKGD
eukprot:TRINITY_DN2348_c0_g2_i6.p1 TRINITY_DN2348_c0_g2~~TRINITY_DN2348_c0_g2_i6.p1  ORF type:complete len:110 (+),score=5.61 TRINITY_DN2348_c0_g2_i6:226-555(+)